MKFLLMLPLAVMLNTCKTPPIPVDSFCNIMNRTAYNGGVFIFNAQEIAGLRRENKEKIVALKRVYREVCLR
jgi:hypothetical protein